MKTRIFALLLLSLLLTGGALAEVYVGSTVAAETVTVTTRGGTVAAAHVCAGEIVEEGEALAELRTTKVYAAEDGTVARILAEAGEAVDGAVLELAPVSRYTIYCTVDGAYQSAQSTFVRTGEALYLRCTANGTHRGMGMVTQINGEEYTVEATAGELYVGETVNLYRDAEFTSAQRVGVGTVVSAGTVSCEAQGRLIRLHVAEGEYVQRGELLFEVTDDEETALVAPVAGIVTEAVGAGDVLQAGQAAFEIVPLEEIEVEIQVDEVVAAKLAAGDEAALIFADDATETPVRGTVERVARIAEGDGYIVRIRPEACPGRLGLTVSVRTYP